MAQNTDVRSDTYTSNISHEPGRTVRRRRLVFRSTVLSLSDRGGRIASRHGGRVRKQHNQDAVELQRPEPSAYTTQKRSFTVQIILGS